jgi:hypothetical protein
MEIDFRFIGWDNSTEPDGKQHDKVWTAFAVNGCYYAGWGARGKALSFKSFGSDWITLHKQSRKKAKNYNEVDAFLLFSIFPNFEEVVSERLTYCVLANKIK